MKIISLLEWKFKFNEELCDFMGTIRYDNLVVEGKGLYRDVWKCEHLVEWKYTLKWSKNECKTFYSVYSYGPSHFKNYIDKGY